MPRIMLVDDHEVFRTALKFLIEQKEKCKVVAEASNGNQFLTYVEKYEPEIIFMDLDIPPDNGLDLLEMVSQKHPHIKVVMCSVNSDALFIQRAKELGAKGWMHKANIYDQAHHIIDTAESDKAFFTSEVTHQNCMI